MTAGKNGAGTGTGIAGDAGVGGTGTFDGLAEALRDADALRRQDSRKDEREQRAALGLQLAAKVLCGRAVEELTQRESWPAPPDFGRLMGFLDRCTDVSRVCEGIERELDWCEGFLDGDAPDLAALGDEAAAVCAQYRTQLIEYAGKLLAPGETLDEAAAPLPASRLETVSQADGGALRELLAEVRAAYGKFRRVIADNGPFSLHPTTSPDGDARVAEEIERLREANAQPYLGPLDDDVMCHVDAFWEGFFKLGATCEGKATVDLAPVASCFSRMADELAAALEGKRLGSVNDVSLLDAIPRERE